MPFGDNAIMGARKHLVLINESTWGTKPGSPTRVHLPVNTYGVKFNADNRKANPQTGLYQRMHSKNYRGMPAGQISCPFYGYVDSGIGISVAEYLTKWAWDTPTAKYMPSKTAEYAEGPDTANREHNGLRVNQWVLTGSEDSGGIELAIDVMGKTEVALVTAATIPNDRHKLIDFEFRDAVLTIGGTVTPMAQFQLQIQNNLKPKYLNSDNPSLLPRAARVVGFSCQLVKEGDAYHAAMRNLDTLDEYDIQLFLRGLHQDTGGTGTDWTTVEFDMPRCALASPDDQGGIEDLTMTQLNFDVLKPMSSAEDVTITWDEE